MLSQLKSHGHMRFKVATTSCMPAICVGFCARIIKHYCNIWSPAALTSSLCICVRVYPMACFSSSLWTGTESFPRKRLMIGRLLANLSFTSISRTSVGSDTKLNLCRKRQRKENYKDRIAHCTVH